MKLRWSKDALGDLIDTRAYIREAAPSCADTLIRELIAGSYRIVYRVESSTMDVESLNLAVA